jgi:hypothetical protein
MMNWSFKLFNFSNFIFGIWFTCLNLKLIPLTITFPVFRSILKFHQFHFYENPEIIVTVSPILHVIFDFLAFIKPPVLKKQF